MTDITNDNATPADDNNYNICQRTGFRVLPGALFEEWNGALVRAESWEPRQMQDFIRPKPELLEGSIRPEPADVFITTAVVVADL